MFSLYAPRLGQGVGGQGYSGSPVQISSPTVCDNSVALLATVDQKKNADMGQDGVFVFAFLAIVELIKKCANEKSPCEGEQPKKRRLARSAPGSQGAEEARKECSTPRSPRKAAS